MKEWMNTRLTAIFQDNLGNVSILDFIGSTDEVGGGMSYETRKASVKSSSPTKPTHNIFTGCLPTSLSPNQLRALKGEQPIQLYRSQKSTLTIDKYVLVNRQHY